MAAKWMDALLPLLEKNDNNAKLSMHRTEETAGHMS